MSAHPNIQPPADASRLPMTLPRLFEKKRLGEPIVMVTAYDFPSARAAEVAGVDLVLVGDSGAMTVLGYPEHRRASSSTRCSCSRGPRGAGCARPFLIGDLPFGSYEVSDEQAVQTAFRFVKEAGCDAVKLEGGGPVSVARARAIVHAGIPVMGHVGLTPQTSTALGGYRAQGRTAGAAQRIAGEALALQDAGCFSLVFEAIPSAVAAELMPLDRDPGHRHRRRPRHRRPGARLPRPARHPRGPRRALRQALRLAAGRDGRGRLRLRRRRAHRPLPRPGARLLDRGAELDAFREALAAL